MSKRSDADYLRDILEAIRRIREYCAGMDFDAFLNDPKTQDAVVRNVEIIGEATKNLSNYIKESHSSVPWSQMARMRDRLVHGYFGVNWDIVWDVVDNDLEVLEEQMKPLIDRN